MTTDEICPKCKMSKFSKTTGSLTGWIASCRCDVVAPETANQTETINLCGTCGKRINQGRVGSFTQFIFRFDICACARPSWAPVSSALTEADREEPSIWEDDTDISEDINPEAFPLERYKPLKVIGSGSGGVVYLCRDLLLNKLVALKTLHTLSGEQLIAFQSEARLLSKLDHPNIVRILDFGVTTSGAPFMVLEHSFGSNLREAMSDTALSAESLVHVFCSLANALNYCHERGVFHRDLKPENILFTRAPDQTTAVKLIDFGIATADTQEKTHFDGKELVGTPAYMPPDQMFGLVYDQRSEVYSLGCVMFETFTGQQVFTGETALEILSKHATEEPPSLSEFHDRSLPYLLENVISTCLSKKPNDRYQSMHEVEQALLTAIDRSVSKIDLATPDRHGGNPNSGVSSANKRARTLATVGLATLTGIAVASVSFFSSNSQAPEKRVETKNTDAKPVARKTYSILDNRNLISISGDVITAEAFKELASKCNKKCSVTFENQPQTINWSGLTELKNSPITNLFVQNTTFGDKECEIVARFPELVKIDLSFTNVTDDGIKALCRSKSISQLVISSSKATNKCLKYLAEMPAITLLEMDHLPDVKLSDLESLQHCQNLTTLNVGHVLIKDEGLRVLCKVTSLRDLNVDSCGISDGGTQALAGTKLERLSLADNSEISDKTVPYLAKIPMLQQFRYGQRNKITADGQKILQSAKPKLEIRHHQGFVVRPRVMDGFTELEELQSFEPELFGSEKK